MLYNLKTWNVIKSKTCEHCEHIGRFISFHSTILREFLLKFLILYVCELLVRVIECLRTLIHEYLCIVFLTKLTVQRLFLQSTYRLKSRVYATIRMFVGY